jgi:tetratricopeptide (TPR) repeat protein
MSLRLSSCLRLAAVVAALGSTALTVSPVRAQVPIRAQADPGTDTVSEDAAGAQKHFDHALEQYRAGHYSAALSSLRDAIELDPDGKDLFFNLAMVHEKLGQLPEAIAAWERFNELETDPAERERARLTIERLHGAQSELVRPAPVAPCPKSSAPSAPAARRPSPVLIGAASVAIVSLVVGTVFGVRALSDDVSDASTSSSLSATALRERGRRAEREALIADVAFSVAAASAGTFACVWLLSPSDPATRAAGITLRSYF